MGTFVLVHGSNGGCWVWQKLRPLLRAQGHEVYAPTLTGMPDRAHLLRCGANLTTHITDVASLLFYQDLSDVALVANSYAGMVITGVAAIAPERLALLVYLDAYVPDDGQNLFTSSAEKARAKGWPVYDLAAGHLAMLTAPEQLSALLLSLELPATA